MQGKKETEGKLPIEYDWEFLEGCLFRMGLNKGKYEPYNWTKEMDVEELKQSLFRHTIEVMKGNYQDESQPYGHLFALACNSMFIFRQLENKKQEKAPLLSGLLTQKQND